jgi:hypothetical protein
MLSKMINPGICKDIGALRRTTVFLQISEMLYLVKDYATVVQAIKMEYGGVRMDKYAHVAIIAANYIQNGLSPQQAWEKASCEVFPKGSTSQKKGCPKNAFLGLFEVNTDSVNAIYAMNARKYLAANPTRRVTPGELWKIVMNGRAKRHNSQMNVVLALYENNLLPV